MPLAGSGCSVAWLARLTGGQEVASSNLAIPTITFPNKSPRFLTNTLNTSVRLCPCLAANQFSRV